MLIQELKRIRQWEDRYIAGKGLIPLLKELGQNLVGIEIGICTGENMYRILEECPNVSMIHAIDPYAPYQDWDAFIDQAAMDIFKKEMIEGLKEYESKTTFYFDFSTKVVSLLPDKVNWIFIDGGHDYDSVSQDLRNYYSKVEVGGIFAGHDWFLRDVQRAIADFRKEFGIIIPIESTSNSVWYWRK
jgi:hypothetical protein